MLASTDVLKHTVPKTKITDSVTTGAKLCQSMKLLELLKQHALITPIFLQTKILLHRALLEPTSSQTVSYEDVRQTDSSTLNTDQELQLTASKTNAIAVFNHEIVKPLSNAPPKMQTSTKPRIRKAVILTDTPEKNALAEKQTKKTIKNEDIAIKKKGQNIDNSKGKGKGKGKEIGNSEKNAKRRVLQESESDSDNDLE